MSGINSFESSNYNGNIFKIKIDKFFKFHNFNFYPNAKSMTPASAPSITTIVNFAYNPNELIDLNKYSQDIRRKVSQESSNYFFEYELTQNLLFDKHTSISVFQNMHLDFCKHNLVNKCNSHSPFNNKHYLEGFKDNYLSKIVSIWQINGSIIGRLSMRFLKEFNKISSYLGPEGQKASVINIFENIQKDISSSKYDLIFAHLPNTSHSLHV